MITRSDLLKEWLGQTCLEIAAIFATSTAKFEIFGQGTSFEVHIDGYKYYSVRGDVANMGKIFFAGRKPEKYLANKVMSSFHLAKVHELNLLAAQELPEESQYMPF